MFSLGLVILVGVSVYLSKKRLKLSVLGIGVVRTHSPTPPPHPPTQPPTHPHAHTQAQGSTQARTLIC